VHDFFGAEVASGNAAPAGGSLVLQLRIGDPGYFTLDVAAEPGGHESGSAEAAFAIVPAIKADATAAPFGVMTHFAKGWATDIIPLIAKAGIGHVRDEQPWRQVERSRGSYDFPSRLTDYMTALAAQHLDPLLVLAFANPLYDDGKTPFSSAGRAGYAAYARAVTERYGQIGAVEVWNEYNGSFCEGPCRSNRPAFYTPMLQEAYRAVKAANPRLTVLGGAAVPIPLDYFQGLFEKGALSAMDAVVIHPYRPEPEGVERDIAALRELMKKYGTEKPIWATEYGDLADMRKSRDDVARYLVRMSTLMLSAGVERMYWYLMRDYQEFTGLGLVREENDPLGRYAPTPAYPAYATLIHELSGTRFVRREPSDPRVRVYLFESSHDEIRVAWAAAPSLTYDVTTDKPIRLVTMMGGERNLAPQNGRVSLALGKDPVYVIGRVAAVAPASAGPGASSVDDFSLVPGTNGWSYGMIVQPDGPAVQGAAFTGPFEPLVANPAQSVWASPLSPTLKIKAGMMHPGRARNAAAWAVRRWTSPSAGQFTISGSAQANDKKSDGVSFAILVDGRVAFATTLGGANDQRRADFNLTAQVARGGSIAFAIGPGRSGGINFDATGLTAYISPASSR